MPPRSTAIVAARHRGGSLSTSARVRDARLRARIDLRSANSSGIAGRQLSDADAAAEHRYGGSGQSRLGILARWRHDRPRQVARSRFDIHRIRRGASVDAGGDVQRTSRRSSPGCRTMSSSKALPYPVLPFYVIALDTGDTTHRCHADRATDVPAARRGSAPELRDSMVCVCGGRPRRSRVRRQAGARRCRAWSCSPRRPTPLSFERRRQRTRLIPTSPNAIPAKIGQACGMPLGEPDTRAVRRVSVDSGQ